MFGSRWFHTLQRFHFLLVGKAGTPLSTGALMVTLRCAEYSAGGRKPPANNTTIRPTQILQNFQSQFMASPSNHI